MILPSSLKTKAEKIAFLIKNKADIIQLKKAAMKYTEPASQLDLLMRATKALSTNYTDDLSSGVIKRDIIGNTYNWMDSQGDVLANGCFEKSIKERADKIFHLKDHLMQTDAKVGKPESFTEKEVSWSDLGLSITGKTHVLMMTSNIMKGYNEKIYEQYLRKEIDQHSVGMTYVRLSLAVDDPEMKEEHSVWSENIESIGNKDAVKEQGYFWYVKEGKLFEVSAVLMGANELTPVVDNKMDDLLKKEAEEKQQQGNFYGNIAEYFKSKSNSK